MNSESIQRVFQLKHDPLSCTSEWVVIEDNDDAELPDTSTDGLLDTTSYLDMLNDSPRNRAFRLAIEKTITRPCHVLDIGAGTGLLSMMAARRMTTLGEEYPVDSNCMVTACESYLPMVKLMRKVVHMNGMGKDINIINKRSDELKVGTDIASRADVLVSEILDSELLGEGLIPTLQHAHDMLLVDNPKTVPYRASTFCQLVESTFLCNMHDLCNSEAKTSDGVHLVPTGLENLLRPKSQQYAMHVNAMEKEVKLLSEPIKIFEFDFWKRPASHGELEVHVKAISEGRIHAIISWWVLQLDSEGTIFYSTAPRWVDSNTDTGGSNLSMESVRDWCDHWKQCVWFTPGAGVSVSKGEKVVLQAAHTCTNILYYLKKTQRLSNEIPCSTSNARDLQLTLPPERIAVYGDNEFRLSMFEAMIKALQGKAHPLCLAVDDSLFLPLTALHICGNSHVISLSPGFKENVVRYLEAVADSNGFSKDRFEYVTKAKLTQTHENKVDLLVGEPYYSALEGVLPWQNLRFWKDRTRLDYLLSKDAVIVPNKGVLRACAMFLPHLWKSRCCLNDVEGFDHAVVNKTLGACGDLPYGKEGPYLPFFIWQCGDTKQLSEEFTIMELDFSKPITSTCTGKVQIDFTKSGVCHGFALWMDWVMDEENSVVVSTGPDKRYWKQGVKLLAEPVTVTAGCSFAVIEASMDPTSSGELIFRHSFS
ncbi:PREDICTED: protein arginine N-methyltransferase 1.6 [Tarenaya hassleriana]|uniref:protein arginine N-methyltransferase 1.6 n=1 Tax=Tarenaya hassleriana TaxID=28532 RepID=UPI00053C9995|nr:PREDICTED: protein arginine N-methyltransferase 1.6 [Tarenaya hassleriana]